MLTSTTASRHCIRFHNVQCGRRLGNLRSVTPSASSRHYSHISSTARVQHTPTPLKRTYSTACIVRATADEGPNMVPLDADSDEGLGGTSDEVFGPLAVLLVGFLEEDVNKFREFMINMEADMVKIVPCTRQMLAGTVQQALESEYPAYEQPPLGLRRLVLVSGMYGSEVMAVIAEYRAAGLPPAVFAAAVPNNWGHQVKELVEEVHSDDQFMKQQEKARREARLEG